MGQIRKSEFKTKQQRICVTQKCLIFLLPKENKHLNEMLFSNIRKLVKYYHLASGEIKHTFWESEYKRVQSFEGNLTALLSIILRRNQFYDS